MKRTFDTVEETLAWARDLAEELRDGEVLALTGDLGAGKTCLSQGIAAGLGVTDAVTSPTFTLVHEYPSGRLPLYHFDFYRVEHPAEILQIGWEDYLDREGVVLVEWADKFPGLLPPHTRWYQLLIDGETRRHLIQLEEAP